MAEVVSVGGFTMKKKREHAFKIAHREAKIGVALVIFNFLWWFGFAYGLGNDDPTNYTYVLGFPAWFFYSCVLGFVVMAVLVIVCVKFLFKDVPFDEDEGGQEQ